MSDAKQTASLRGLWLTDVQVAEYLGISVGTIRRWRLHNRGPEFRKFNGDSVRYSRESLDTWATSQPAGGELVETAA